jgi:hypothetical protein
MVDAKSRLDTATTNARVAKAQIDELLSLVDCFDAADIGVKHMIIARLVDRVEVRTGYKVSVKFKISLDQYLGNKSA